MSLISFYCFIYRDRTILLLSLYTRDLTYLRDEESSSMIDMWPEMLLEYHFEGVRIFLSYRVDHSLVLEEIHTAGRVYHLTSYLQCYDRSIEELLLESSDGFYIFYMPVLRRISTLKEGPFTTTRSVEEDTIECLWSLAEVLPWIESDSYICASHAIEILQKLRDTLSGRLICDDEWIRIHLTELCRLATGTCCHIEYDEIRTNILSFR